MPCVSRTRATLRSAEFGFFGVVVYTRVQTPRRCGAATFFLRPLPDLRPGVASFFFGVLRPLRTSWLVVGMWREILAAARGRRRPHRARGAAEASVHQLAAAQGEPELDAVAGVGEAAARQLLDAAHAVAERVAVAVEPLRGPLPL